MMLFTKSQLLTKYDISFEALETLLGSGHLASPFVNKGGLSMVSLTREDEFALESARVTVSGFRGATLLPYHRFLILRFLCLPLKDVYEELINCGLLASKERFEISFLEKIYNTAVKRAPELIQKVFETKRPPTGKNREKFDEFLSILNIKIFYEDPERVDELSFFLQIRTIYELIMSTAATNKEVSAFFSKYLAQPVPIDSILAYRLLYYAAHELSPDAWNAYLETIPPDDRKARATAYKKNTREYSMMKGIEGLASTAEILEQVKIQSLKEFGNISGFQTPGAMQAKRAAFDQLLKIEEYTRNLGGSKDSEDVWKVFHKFTIRQPEETKVLTIKDIQEMEEEKKDATG